MSALPAFDPGHPDAKILGAYYDLRAHHTRWYAGWDDAEARRDPEEESKASATLFALEEAIYRNPAQTIGGVIAKLAVKLIEMHTGAAEERALGDRDIMGLAPYRDGFDGHCKVIFDAIIDLLRIEWDRALATWEAAYADHNRAIGLKSCVDHEHFRQTKSGSASTESEAAYSAADEVTTHFCHADCDALEQLIRTTPPDWTEYRRKADIAIKQGFAGDAAPWLLRDANFLLGASAGRRAA